MTTKPSRQGRLVLPLLVFCVVLSGMLAMAPRGHVHAADILEQEATRHGVKLKEAFRELITETRVLALQVEINSGHTIPGTLIDSVRGWVVAKASEMGKVVLPKDEFRCRISVEEWVAARYVGYEPELDLVFLELESRARLPEEVPIAQELKPGQWVISLGFEERLPLGVGVLGAQPREIATSSGYLGMAVEETADGLLVTQVLANSGASQAGIRKGDLLYETPDSPMHKRTLLEQKLKELEPGDWWSFHASREGVIRDVHLRIGVSWDKSVDRQALMNRFGSDVSPRRTGFRSVFQHDTLMHPRHCGGPVVNLNGELVGVNIARAGRTDTFTVPIQEILKTANDLAARTDEQTTP